MAINLKSIVGRKLGLSPENALISNELNVTMPAVDADITVGDESSNVRAITIQLKDANGDDIDYVETFDILLFGDTAKTSFASAPPSAGLEIGTDGALQTVVTKLQFTATTEADGDWDGTWTDTATTAAYLGLRLPNGRVVLSDALTNA